MLQLPNLEKSVLWMVTRLIDVGSTLKCIPYKRASPNDYTSIDLQLTSWCQFLLVTTLLCSHSVAQWISLFNYVPSHGLNIQASLHLIFISLYTYLFVFSVQQVLHPDALLNAQNQIQRTQKSFRRTWTHHPVMILFSAVMQGILWLSPLFTLGVYLLDPTSPMFVVSNFLNIRRHSLGFTNVIETIKWTIAAVLESIVVFTSLLVVTSVSQTYIIIQVAMNMWMEDLRSRTKQAQILIYSDWVLFNKLYRRTQIFSVLSNCFWSPIIMPANAVLVVLTSAGSIFCTLRLHGHLHPLVYVFFPTLTVFMIVGSLFGVFGQFSKINLNACGCMHEILKEGRNLRALWAWNAGDEDTKCVKMQLRAMRSFGVQVGIFGFVTASTQFAMLGQIINYVILLLSL